MRVASEQLRGRSAGSDLGRSGLACLPAQLLSVECMEAKDRLRT